MIRDGVFEHTPTAGRSSIGFDGSGTLRVTRFAFAGTWKGTGQRRPLAGVNQKPKGNQTVLFTPAWGQRRPRSPMRRRSSCSRSPPQRRTPTCRDGRRGVDRLGGDPARRRGARRQRRRGGEARERGAGGHAGHRAADPAVGLERHVTSALGGGPLLVRNHKAVFKTSENFASDQLALRDARAGIGQLDDGRVLLVAVDGGAARLQRRDDAYELAQTMVRLGAVTAAARRARQGR